VSHNFDGDHCRPLLFLCRDERNRPHTTMEGLAELEPVKGPGKFITASNASQLPDGAAAVVFDRITVTALDCTP
jgi:acetyl-CoA acetyltransferase